MREKYKKYEEEGGKRVSTSTISIFRELDKMYCGVKKRLRSSRPHLEQAFSRLPARAQLGAGCHAKVPIIIMDGAVLNQKVNSLEKFSPLVKNDFRQ